MSRVCQLRCRAIRTVGWLAASTLCGVLPVVAQGPAGIDYETARLDRTLKATRAAGPIALDGALDEPSWVSAPIARGFLQNEPREGQPATFDTEVRVLYDERGALLRRLRERRRAVGAHRQRLEEGLQHRTPATASRVVIDTFADHRNGFEFATNPAGAKWDAQMSNEGREINANWDGIWDVRDAHRPRTAGTPRSGFRFARSSSPTRDPQTWGVNFERRIRRRNEESFWSPLPRIYNLERVSLAGSLEGCAALRPGRTCGSSRTRRRVRARWAVGRAVGDFDVGLDVKYGVTTGLTLDCDGQHRLLAGRSRRAAGEPHALQRALSREARLLPRELGHLPVRSAVDGHGDSRGRRQSGGRRPAELAAGHPAVLQPADRPVGCRRGDPDPRRHRD